MTARPTSLELEARREQLAAEMGEAITLDGLTRDHHIFQRRRGHRHSTDDLLTAWYAVVHAPSRVRDILDLGTGIGSVALSVAWAFPDAAVKAVEVQAVSFRLLQANVWASGAGDRVLTVHGDLRDLPPAELDLVTGSPPYFDVRSGIVSADSQRAAARFELHGDVFDYCRTARRSLRPDGRFVFCFPTVQRARAELACAQAALEIVCSRDVIPRQGLPPLFSLFACRTNDTPSPPPAPEPEPPLVVRDAGGQHTPELTAARRVFGLV